jgi:predicted transcriptional regulator
MGFDFLNIKKGLFTVKAKEENDQSTKSETEEPKVSYEQYGVRQAAAMHGSTEGLKVCLTRVFDEHMADMRRDEQKQEELRRPYREKLQELQSEQQTIANKIKTIEEGIIPSQKVKIQDIRKEIADIRQNPESHNSHAVGRFGYYMGAVILVFLTLYLFIFYSSASYSALFKEFKVSEGGAEIKLSQAIFDPNAIKNAYQDGWTELVLILTIPFVFIGLGYLIHKFQEGKSKVKYFKIALLIFITFIFDAILAFEITKKIYDIDAGSKFVAQDAYSINLALKSVNFWLIIFAGFLVYIVWGFVFDFFVDANSKLDSVKVKIRHKQERINAIEEEIHKNEQEINELKRSQDSTLGAMNKLRDIIGSTIIQPREVKEALSQFMVGWYKYLAIGRIYSRSEHNKIYDEFLVLHVNSIEPLINPN